MKQQTKRPNESNGLPPRAAVESLRDLAYRADPENGLPEAERQNAALTLMFLFRVQADANCINPLLAEIVASFVFAHSDPRAALERFLGKQKNNKKYGRDLDIIGDIERKREAGATRSDAIRDVAKQRRMKFDRVEIIYKKKNLLIATCREVMGELSAIVSEGVVYSTN